MKDSKQYDDNNNSIRNNDDGALMATSLSVMDDNRSATIHSNGSFSLLPPTDLLSKLAGDVIVACGVTFGIAPFMSVIDKSIVQRAAGTHSIVQSCTESVTTIARKPVTFLKSPMFLMMWGVYAATYTTANCLKTLIEHEENCNQDTKHSNTPPPPSSSGKLGVFVFTTTINSATTMMKDRFYASHFGTTNQVTKMPLITYGLWGLRDCMVIGSSFILPEYMCSVLQEQTGDLGLDKKSALQISQLTCPIVTQLVAGPVQLLGLDFYNRPLSNYSYKAAVVERMKFQYMNFTSIVGARIARIAPAYGIGGVGNTYFRDIWRDYVDNHNMMESNVQFLR